MFPNGARLIHVHGGAACTGQSGAGQAINDPSLGAFVLIRLAIHDKQCADRPMEWTAFGRGCAILHKQSSTQKAHR